ncbi:YphA family membrane protein [Gracilibacillus salinarum]|uniref:Uncharacterized protein n=1 Tax=Gracilibacillus salinarum TaxID=2932255 RepID=A0ABY4GNX5_9BACI|nr:hypothetical protein [Gracilibacillus salinarum]UOQ85893.1 hypothetical protein MUN87_03005 [Gracilibacillus salinarum]
MAKSKDRLKYLVLLYLSLILLPIKLIIGDLPVNGLFLFLLIYAAVMIILTKFPLKKYLLILFISYIYAVYFIWRITSPVLDENTFIMIAIISGFLLIHLFTKNKDEQITIIIAGSSFGQFFYLIICTSYHLQYTVNYDIYFTIIFSILFIIAIQSCWEYLMIKIESFIKSLEYKKRWNT